MDTGLLFFQVCGFLVSESIRVLVSESIRVRLPLVQHGSARAGRRCAGSPAWAAAGASFGASAESCAHTSLIQVG